jgi:hypothetical protein
MGDRGQVKIGKVYLYTHWGAYNLINALQIAIGKKWRWGDEEYLTRIIFEEMVGDEKGTETGFGIGTLKHTDIWRFVEINGNNIKITDNDKVVFNDTFDKFLEYKEEEEK